MLPPPMIKKTPQNKNKPSGSESGLKELLCTDLMPGDNEMIAIDEWLKSYTWIQEDGTIDPSRPRIRPEGLEVDPRERKRSA